jgi:sporulation protein YlmC with PRC-barrel domain
MIRIFLPLICAALGFAAASCSQSDTPFSSAEAPSAPQSASHEASAAAMPSSPQAQGQGQDAGQAPSDPSDPPNIGAQSAAEPDPDSDAPSSTPVERRASTLIGIPVVSTDGSPLGEVKDIIFDRQGRATHLVLAYGSQPDTTPPADTPGDGKPVASADGKLTAMPWDAAVASMKDDHLVLDGSKLQDAPSFTPDAWPDLDDPAWSAAADTYWRKAVQAAIAAHPGAPIDSTDRQRGRRSRAHDGTIPP